tara:strand:+ start:1677 stop:1952 length:276 start_codon:yes stop_codon:yes gene_type:complete
MKVKLQSGKEVMIKDLTVDERDELLDNVETETDGESIKIKAMHSTMTKFIRMGVAKADDKFIKSLTFAEKTEIFQVMQEEYLNLGEGEASK